MDINNTPTKGNLMQIQKTLDLSRSGYLLMDRKRIILMNELIELLNKASGLQDDLKKLMNWLIINCQLLHMKMVF